MSSQSKRVIIAAWMHWLVLHSLGCGQDAVSSPVGSIDKREVVVSIQRERPDCKLKMIATSVDTGAIMGSALVLDDKTESSFVLSTRQIAQGVRGIAIGSICVDDNNRIVEMGDTIVATPPTSHTVQFATRRLPNSDSWYKMLPDSVAESSPAVQQRAVWANDFNAAVIVAMEGRIRSWNGYGWTDVDFKPFGCVDFLEAVAGTTESSAFILGRTHAGRREPYCTGSSLGYSFDFNKKQLLGVNTLTANWRSASSGFNPTAHNKLTLYTTGSTDSRVLELYSSPLNGEFTHKELYVKNETSMAYGVSEYISASSLIAPGRQELPLLLSMLIGNEKYVWRLPGVSKLSELNISPKSEYAGRKLSADTFIAQSIAASASANRELYWIVGLGINGSTVPPVSAVTADGDKFAPIVSQSTFRNGAGDIVPDNITEDPFQCVKAYAIENNVYVACNRSKGMAWILKCDYQSTSSVSCSSQPLDMAGSPKSEQLIGIHGALLGDKIRIWAIGNMGSIWLYQN